PGSALAPFVVAPQSPMPWNGVTGACCRSQVKCWTPAAIDAVGGPPRPRPPPSSSSAAGCSASPVVVFSAPDGVAAPDPLDLPGSPALPGPPDLPRPAFGNAPLKV